MSEVRTAMPKPLLQGAVVKFVGESYTMGRELRAWTHGIVVSSSIYNSISDRVLICPALPKTVDIENSKNLGFIVGINGVSYCLRPDYMCAVKASHIVQVHQRGGRGGPSNIFVSEDFVHAASMAFLGRIMPSIGKTNSLYGRVVRLDPRTRPPNRRQPANTAAIFLSTDEQINQTGIALVARHQGDGRGDDMASFVSPLDLWPISAKRVLACSGVIAHWTIDMMRTFTECVCCTLVTENLPDVQPAFFAGDQTEKVFAPAFVPK